MLLKIVLAAMKVPRLGLQVNYTQDSSRHNNNAENNEIQKQLMEVETDQKKSLKVLLML